MIARLWSAQTTQQLADAYLKYFSQHVLPELRSVPGYFSAQVLTDAADDTVKILVITFWQSLEAVAAFAGSDIESAVVHPAAAALLTSYDRRVRHFGAALLDVSGT